jgi:hypothetical protein
MHLVSCRGFFLLFGQYSSYHDVSQKQQIERNQIDPSLGRVWNDNDSAIYN